MPTRRHLLFASATGLAALAALSSSGRRALVGRAFAAPPAGAPKAAPFEITLSDAEWHRRLTPAQYAILREAAAERDDERQHHHAEQVESGADRRIGALDREHHRAREIGGEHDLFDALHASESPPCGIARLQSESLRADAPSGRLSASRRHPDTSNALRIIAVSSIGIEQSSASPAHRRAARDAHSKKPAEAGWASRFRRLEHASGFRPKPRSPMRQAQCTPR